MMRPWRSWLFLATAAGVSAAPIVFTLPRPARRADAFWSMGAARTPGRHVLTVDGQCLRFDGQGWLPAAAEFFPGAVSATTCRDSLLRLRTAGVEILVVDAHAAGAAPGVDGNGPTPIRLPALARELGFYVIIRWSVPSESRDAPRRPPDEGGTGATEALRALADALHGQLWKDGGPVIGVEFDGRGAGGGARATTGDELRRLKQTALDAGLDLPLYLACGWTQAALQAAAGDVVPLVSAGQPPVLAAPDFTGGLCAGDDAGARGGEHPSGAMDAEHAALRALAKGSVFLQYALPPDLQSSAARAAWHRLRRLHLFLRDCGSDLALMPAFEPNDPPAGAVDTTVRSDGWRGFVFARTKITAGRPEAGATGFQFELRLADGQILRLPREPVTLPAGAAVWWPFNLNLGHITLVSATARLVTHVVDPAGTRTLIFAATDGVPPEFVLRAEQVNRIETRGSLERVGDTLVVKHLRPAHAPALRVLTTEGSIVQIVVVSDAESLQVWKGRLAGRDRVAITKGEVVFGDDAVRVTLPGGTRAALALRPSPTAVRADDRALTSVADGAFGRWALPIAPDERTWTISADPDREPRLPQNFRTDVAVPPPPRGF